MAETKHESLLERVSVFIIGKAKYLSPSLDSCTASSSPDLI
jgi:hypothetical protein